MFDCRTWYARGLLWLELVMLVRLSVPSEAWRLKTEAVHLLFVLLFVTMWHSRRPVLCVVGTCMMPHRLASSVRPGVAIRSFS